MSSPLDEIKRLRAEVEVRDRQLAELQGLVGKHLEATSGDEDRALERELAAYERGEQDGDTWGYRRGIEHALVRVDEAHMAGNPHDEHGRMKELGLHDGPVPPRMTADERVAAAEAASRREAEWWWHEYNRTHPEPQRQAEVRQMRPKQRGIEREAG